MAGIGFVLERIIDRGRLRDIAGATIAGVLVVAGPWLISSVALFVLSIWSTTEKSRFLVLVVYSYATTLVLFGGYHYRFTRLLADLLYSKDFTAVRRVYQRALVVAVAWGLPPAVLVGFLAGWSHWGVVVPVFVYVTVNVTWIHTLVASLLEDFRAVIASYLTGAAIMVATVFVSAAHRRTLNLLAVAFAVGLLVTGIFLWFAIDRTLRRRARIVARRHTTHRLAVSAPASLQRLSVIGWGLAFVLWIDKIVYWFRLGAPTVAESWLPLYPVYDQAVFVGQLFVVPAMVVFIVRVETAYFRGLRTMLRALRVGTYDDLTRARALLERSYNAALGRQAAIQLLMVVVTVLLAPEVARLTNVASVRLLVVASVAAQAYFFFYTQMVNLLYLADYRAAMHVVTATAVLTWLIVELFLRLFGAASVGYAFLCAVTIGGCLAWVAQRRGLRDFDWLVLTRFNA